ncbi:MAG: ABC transporter ATP-binding protein [Lachnospiraceae bacterium]|nr:ABC transporter ATP-binding protein [Lachnospiraceae bacterium]
MKIVSCKDITIGYDNQPVFSHLSFDIEEGDYISVLGENGSGKSTLIKTLLGLTKPLSGNISLLEGLTHETIGYLPQQTTAQRDFPASVEEIVMSGFLGQKGWKPFYTKKERLTAAAHMEELSIDSLAKKNYRNLSGGQQQKVLLARALCAAKKLLILDEPVTGLDPAAQTELYQMINHLNQCHNMTIVMISHDITSAIRYSSKILHLGTDEYFYGSQKEYLSSKLYQNWKGVM